MESWTTPSSSTALCTSEECQASAPQVGLLERNFTFDIGGTVRLFRQAALDIGLPGLALYQLRLRHGGAFEDTLGTRRPMAEMCARGMWRNDTSLRRYAKPSMLQRLLWILTPEALSYCRTASTHLQDLLFRRRSPRALPPRNALAAQGAPIP